MVLGSRLGHLGVGGSREQGNCYLWATGKGGIQPWDMDHCGVDPDQRPAQPHWQSALMQPQAGFRGN